MKAAAVLSTLAFATASPHGNYSKGYKRQPWPNDLDMKVATITAEDIAAAPGSVDWSSKGATSAINNQKNCGSCWAFSTMEGVESGVFMSTGKLPPKLSVQELVACEKEDDGCNGGDIPEAVSYLKKKGMTSAADYPDTSSKSGRSGKCKKFTPVVKVTGMQYAIPPCSSGKCKNQDEDKLAAALAKYGPLSICLNADWDSYDEGILNTRCSSKASDMDHCVQLVGYDKTASKPYWKVRNSWAASWGESGFIRLPFGKNACGVANEAVIISATTESEHVVV